MHRLKKNEVICEQEMSEMTAIFKEFDTINIPNVLVSTNKFGNHFTPYYEEKGRKTVSNLWRD